MLDNCERLVDSLPTSLPLDNRTAILRRYYAAGVVEGYLNQTDGRVLVRHADGEATPPNDLGLPPFYAIQSQSAPLLKNSYQPGMKNHRSIQSRRLVVDAVIRTARVAWSGLLFNVAEYSATRKFALTAAVFAPLFSGDPAEGDAGRGNVTGVASTSFKFNSVLNGTTPQGSDVFVVVGCSDRQLAFNFSEYGLRLDLDTSRFTMRLTDGNAENLGWGARRYFPSCRAVEALLFRAGWWRRHHCVVPWCSPAHSPRRHHTAPSVRSQGTSARSACATWAWRWSTPAPSRARRTTSR